MVKRSQGHRLQSEDRKPSPFPRSDHARRAGPITTDGGRDMEYDGARLRLRLYACPSCDS